MLSWLRSIVRRHSRVRPWQAPRPLRAQRLEELEGRALPNDFYLSLLHAFDASASVGPQALTSQPGTQAGIAVDQQKDDAALLDPFTLSVFPSDRPRARHSTETNSSSIIPHGLPGSAVENAFTITPRFGNPFPAAAASRAGVDPLTHNSPNPQGPTDVYWGRPMTGSEGSPSLFAPAPPANFIAPVNGHFRNGFHGTATQRLSGHGKANLPAHVLIGYWHTFGGPAGVLRLRDVSPDFDVVNIAFGVPGGGSSSRIVFSPGVEGDAEFRSDLATLQSQGRAVLLSIGGAGSPVRLNTGSDVNNFVSSVSGIVGSYGFDGIDIDFENGSLQLNAGDTDINNPTSPTVLNLISALHQLSDQFGPGFVITMAPETFGVQFAFAAYGGERGGTRGAYVPVINLTRDILTYVHVQDYNTGSVTALDFRDYSQGSADFHVAMTDMLLRGFPIAGGRFGRFEALDPTQVAFGVPASPGAGQGYIAPSELRRSLDYLINGIPFGGQYQLTDSYPTMLGLMTWSINWDRANGFQLSSAIGPYLHG